MRAQRRWNTGDDDVAFAHAQDIDRRIERCAEFHVADERFTQVLEIILAAMKGVDLGLIDVEPDDGKPGAMKRRHQRQADVTQADDANHGRVIVDFGLKIHV